MEKFELLIALAMICGVQIIQGDRTWDRYLETVDRISKSKLDNYYPVAGEKEDDSNINEEFGCNILVSPEPPNSVHQLRPGDIKVVGALGDSITAGFGAKAENLAGVAIQARGVAANAGGDANLDTVTTLPNILRKYNEKLYGYSTGTGGADEPNAKFNVAVGGAQSINMPGQAEDLVYRISNDVMVDYENDWKLVSIFIGGNDLCQWCNDEEKRDPVKYVANIEESINILKAMPKTFVNVIGILNVYQVGNITGVTCDVIHQAVCNCGMGDNEKITKLKEINKEYQRLMEESITSGKFDTREDFTVVYQPFFHDTDLPVLPDGTVDNSYFSPDCFHFSEKGHRAGARAVWNNMIQPVGEKDVSWYYEEIRCPTKESPYLYTNVNSKPTTFGVKAGVEEQGYDELLPQDSNDPEDLDYYWYFDEQWGPIPESYKKHNAALGKNRDSDPAVPDTDPNYIPVYEPGHIMSPLETDHQVPAWPAQHDADGQNTDSEPAAPVETDHQVPAAWYDTAFYEYDADEKNTDSEPAVPAQYEGDMALVKEALGPEPRTYLEWYFEQPPSPRHQTSTWLIILGAVVGTMFVVLVVVSSVVYIRRRKGTHSEKMPLIN